MEKDGAAGLPAMWKAGPRARRRSAEDPEQSRRSLLSWLLGGGVAASLASFFYPVIRFLNPPACFGSLRRTRWTRAKSQDLKPNSGQDREVRKQAGLADARQRHRVEGFLGRVHAFELHRAVPGTATQQIWCACHNGTVRPERPGGLRAAAQAARGVCRARSAATKLSFPAGPDGENAT